jgi:hypothetical protein
MDRPRLPAPAAANVGAGDLFGVRPGVVDVDTNQVAGSVVVQHDSVGDFVIVELHGQRSSGHSANAINAASGSSLPYMRFA